MKSWRMMLNYWLMPRLLLRKWVNYVVEVSMNIHDHLIPLVCVMAQLVPRSLCPAVVPGCRQVVCRHSNPRIRIANPALPTEVGLAPLQVGRFRPRPVLEPHPLRARVLVIHECVRRHYRWTLALCGSKSSSPSEGRSPKWLGPKCLDPRSGSFLFVQVCLYPRCGWGLFFLIRFRLLFLRGRMRMGEECRLAVIPLSGNPA